MWTKQETLRMRELQTGLKTVDEIAVDLNKSQLDVTNKLMSMGYKPIQKRSEPEQATFPPSKAVEIPQRKKRMQITPEIEQRVVQLRKQRFNFSEIAKRTGVSQSTASRIVQRHGLPSEKRYVDTKKEPDPVAAETSSENIKTHSNITTPAAVCKELLKEAETVLDNIDVRDIGDENALEIGKALGAIRATLKIMEV